MNLAKKVSTVKDIYIFAHTVFNDIVLNGKTYETFKPHVIELTMLPYIKNTLEKKDYDISKLERGYQENAEAFGNTSLRFYDLPFDVRDEIRKEIADARDTEPFTLVRKSF